MATTEAEGDEEATVDEKDRAILDFIRDQPGGFAGTAEVAEEVDLTTNGAAYRLKKLRKLDRVDSRIVSRDEVWYPASAPTPDGGFSWLTPHLAGIGEWLGVPSAVLTIVFAVLAIWWSWFLYPAIVAMVIAGVGAYNVLMFHEYKPPSWELKDFKNDVYRGIERSI